GYFQEPVDPYGVSRVDDLHMRADYPPLGACGSDVLWTQCPPTMPTVVILPPPAPQFDFSVGFVAVDGNILRRGNTDGVIDFIDNFNDGSMSILPTSAFSSFGPVDESG